MYPDRQQPFESIHPGMKLDKAFFLKVYGYEISFPGFADEELRPVARQLRKRWGGGCVRKMMVKGIPA